MFRPFAAALTASILLAAACTSAAGGPSPSSPIALTPTPIALTPTPVPTQPPPTPGPGGWVVDRIEPAAGSAMPSSIARLGDGYLAVGGLECVRPTALATPASEVALARLASTKTFNPGATPEPEKTCFGGIWWSPDGLSWQDLTLRLAVALGSEGWAEGGPDPGFGDVAVRGDRVVVVGRDRAGPMAWLGDGTTGLRPATNPEVFAGSELAAVTASPSGFVIVGTDASGATPRAAVWSSSDGSSWTRVEDVPAFEVGVFTPVGMEGARIAGGMRDVAVGGPGLVAVGETCDQWGVCSTAAWWSTDGTAWSRGDTEAGPGGIGSVAVGPSGAVAVGGGSLLLSTDGKTWTRPAPAGGVGPFTRVAASATGFVALQGSQPAESKNPVPRLWASADGVAWQLVPDVPQFGFSGAEVRGADLVATPGIVVVWWETDAFGMYGPPEP